MCGLKQAAGHRRINSNLVVDYQQDNTDLFSLLDKVGVILLIGLNC